MKFSCVGEFCIEDRDERDEEGVRARGELVAAAAEVSFGTVMAAGLGLVLDDCEGLLRCAAKSKAGGR